MILAQKACQHWCNRVSPTPHTFTLGLTRLWDLTWASIQEGGTSVPLQCAWGSGHRSWGLNLKMEVDVWLGYQVQAILKRLTVLKLDDPGSEVLLLKPASQEKSLDFNSKIYAFRLSLGLASDQMLARIPLYSMQKIEDIVQAHLWKADQKYYYC